MNRKTCPHGTFHDYRKISIYRRGHGYIGSTTWSRTCKEALSVFLANSDWAAKGFKASDFVARFDRSY